MKTSALKQESMFVIELSEIGRKNANSFIYVRDSSLITDGF